MEEIEKDRAALAWFTAAWDDYLNGLPVLLPVVLALALVSGGVFYIIHRWQSFYAAIPYMLFVLTPVATGANLVYIRLARGTGTRFTDLFSAFPVYPRALAVSFGLALVTMGGVLLLVIPGVILYLTYIFSEYAVVDRRTGIKESFQLSSDMTYGWKTRLFPVFLLAFMTGALAPDILSVSGELLKAPSVNFNLKPWTIAAYVLKTFVFLPWLSLALARAYNQLLAQPAAAPAAPQADA